MDKPKRLKNQELSEEEKLEILLSMSGTEDDNINSDGTLLDDDGAVYFL